MVSKKHVGSEKLGETIRRLRRSLRLTQSQLALAIGVDESYVSKIETGRLPYTPSEETLRLIARQLNTDPLELLSLAKKAPSELKSAAQSQSAREFFELVRERRLENRDWQDLTDTLRRRLEQRDGRKD
ncbi:MAG: HTH-type transcriptional regulator, competence development regulator [Blastocatellia bacterium]|jgi:transcriptional regulator with XRE-family HTH domain|nr:HTH-type transcriptional regulator, competence development regulator [Blastocatellia bacterium]